MPKPLPIEEPELQSVHTIAVVDTEEKCTQAIEQIMRYV